MAPHKCGESLQSVMFCFVFSSLCEILGCFVGVFFQRNSSGLISEGSSRVFLWEILHMRLPYISIACKYVSIACMYISIA